MYIVTAIFANRADAQAAQRGLGLDADEVFAADTFAEMRAELRDLELLADDAFELVPVPQCAGEGG